MQNQTSALHGLESVKDIGVTNENYMRMIKDFMAQYNRVSEYCFNNCVKDFTCRWSSFCLFFCLFHVFFCFLIGFLVSSILRFN
ncbi:unnamed protein product [Dracunculus medinensis]|uniref:Zf-Tim10_DDP domain-containing protein n=1 Tax=Dracunculus medinensis TaxID=318479 RepID=A0A0N4UN45_DRAME|nr:unnamed protein product [Dracunculus medinensis]